MSGQWPPDWEDPDEVFPDQADQLDDGSRGPAVRGIRVPGLGSRSRHAGRRRAARISAALAAEAAARPRVPRSLWTTVRPRKPACAVDNQPRRRTAGRPGIARSLWTTGRRRRRGRLAPGRSAPPRPRRVRRWRRSLQTLLVAGPVLAVCLLFAGIGYAAVEHAPRAAPARPRRVRPARPSRRRRVRPPGPRPAGTGGPASAAEPVFTVTQQRHQVPPGTAGRAGTSRPGGRRRRRLAGLSRARPPPPRRPPSAAAGQSPTPALARLRAAPHRRQPA